MGGGLGIDLVIDQRRTHVSRTDGIHRDAVRTTFKGCGFGQTHHAVFGRYVGRFELAGAQAMHRADVDDSPPSVRFQVRPGILREQEGCGQHQANNEIPFVFGKIFHRADMLNSGIVDQDVDRAEFGDSCIDQGFACRSISEVYLDKGGAELVGFALPAFGIYVCHDNLVIIAGKGLGDGQANATCGTGDNSNFL